MDLPELPEAIYCFADVLAFGAMHAAHARGMHAPDDFALAGFDGTEAAQWSVPTLTTIAPDVRDMATHAVDALIERISAPSVLPHRDIACAYDLLIGQSSSSPRATPARATTGRRRLLTPS